METSLLVVDVQPGYRNWCGHIAPAVAKRINNTRKPVNIFWVGEGFTNDTEEDVRDYLNMHGARPGKLDQCHFIEKDYGFFRSWMDSGVDRDFIVAVGKRMMAQGVYGSEDLDLFDLQHMYEDRLFESLIESVPDSDPLRMPSFAPGRLQYFDAFETCGGGNAECLAEIELWLEMKGKSYERLDHLIY